MVPAEIMPGTVAMLTNACSELFTSAMSSSLVSKARCRSPEPNVNLEQFGRVRAGALRIYVIQNEHSARTVYLEG